MGCGGVGTCVGTEVGGRVTEGRNAQNGKAMVWCVQMGCVGTMAALSCPAVVVVGWKVQVGCVGGMG